jgi:hypothetical protein
MAIPKKKGKKGKKTSDSKSEESVANSQKEEHSAMTFPGEEILVKEVPPPTKEKASSPPPPKAPPVLSVKPVADPKTKVEVVGRRSINFSYGGQRVGLIEGKKTRIPASAIEHCKRLKLI